MLTPGVWQIGPDASFADNGDPILVNGLARVWPLTCRRPRVSADTAPTLSLAPAPAGWMLRHEGVAVCAITGETDLPPALEKLIAAWLQAFTRSAAVLHAALLRDQGRVMLLPAERRSGKSTFCLLRAQRGAEYGGDDLVMPHLENEQLHPVAKAITVKEGSFPFLPGESPTWSDPVRGPIRYWHPPSVISNPVPFAEIRALVLPRFAPGGSPSIRLLPRSLAALTLVQQLFGGLDRNSLHLDLIRRLSEIPAFALVYPDAGAMHILADELVGSL